MADSWRPSKIEHDVIVVLKERQDKSKRGLHSTELLRFTTHQYSELYSKSEIKDAITVLEGQRFIKNNIEIQKIPSIKDFSGKVKVPARSYKLELYTVSDKGILYLREMEGIAPEGPGVQLYTSKEPYSIRRLFEELFSNANTEIKIIDNYLGRKTLDFLMAANGKNIITKILTTDRTEFGFDEALEEFLQQFDGQVLIQETSGVFHGRVIIIDDQAYIIDHSIKDFGSKPSSIVKVDEPVINGMYNELFDSNWHGQ